MIDIAILRKQPELVRELVRKRGSGVDVERLISVDTEVRAIQTDLERLRHERRNLAANGDRSQAQRLRDDVAELETKFAVLRDERDGLWALLPNLLPEDTPEGEDDAGNLEIDRWGDLPEFSFTPKTHEVIGAELDILDLKRGTRTAGAGFYYWKGDGARLAWAIFSLALDFLSKREFVPMMTPQVARRRTLFGTGYLPFFEEEVYKIAGEDLCLIGTSEQTLVGYHDDEILADTDLPLKYTAFSACFRTEAGAAGKKSRGAFRVHQFHKVEQIVFCRPHESEEYHQQCQRNVSDFMRLLEIPHRTVRVCLGDLGAPAYKKYDVEGWFAGFGMYRETHSNTNLLDYQTRRLNVRCRGAEGTFFPHTISATMITDRAALAILENNQQADGSVVIPDALRPLLAGQREIVRRPGP
jgi:seryl-tRNA synthetase